MRIVNPGKGLLAALALAGLQAATPAGAQYATYPQQPAVYPQATQQSYAQPAQQTYAQPVAQPAQQGVFAQPTMPQPGYLQVAQRPVAQPALSQSTLPQQAYNPQQVPQQAAPANVYSQYAPAPGYSPARPAAMANPYASPAPSATAAPSYSQQPTRPANPYAAAYSPPRVAMAYQQPAINDDNLPLTPPAENVVPVPANGNGYMPTPVPGEQYPADPAMPATNGVAMGAPAGADCNCQPGYESYPGYGYNGTAYGSCNTYSTYGDQPGMMARVLGKHGGGYWFGGVYGLVMERDSGSRYPLAFAGTGLAPGDYPMPSDVVMTTRDVDSDFQGGLEFRLGRTCGGYTDPCGGCSYGPKWGVEGVYWELFEDNEYEQYVDNGSVRTYSMMPMRGLMYDPGSGDMPVNEFWDYAPPVATSTIVVTMTKARSSFEVRNAEINLLRLSICGDACAGPAMCDVGCDSGSCDTCATGQCATGDCAANGYGYGIGRGGLISRFSCTGVCGVRYLELDESFMYGVNYYNTTTTTDGFLDYWANTENRLVGFQLGCNGMYRIGCKWGLHMNTLVGVYGNDIDVEQYFQSPTGMVTYTTGEEFDVNASKTDVAMLGELRLGASYQATCHCRVYGGWRAMGITGVALATNQTPVAFLDATQMSNYVNSNGSMILHGLQTGVEWNY
jgi:hypothetical protein